MCMWCFCFLFRYFSQILEEHGPLKLDDEILIAEYKKFPEETKRMVEASGGLKNFLLGSLLFSMDGDMVTLTGYDIPYLEHDEGGHQLNPTANEFTPSFSRPVLDNIDLYSDPSQPEPKNVSSRSADASRPSNPHSDIAFNYAEYPVIRNNFDQRTLDSPDNPTSDTDQDSSDDDDTDEASASSSDSDSSSFSDEDGTVSETTSLSQDHLHMGELDSNISQSFDSESQPRNKRTAIVSVQVRRLHCVSKTMNSYKESPAIHLTSLNIVSPPNPQHLFYLSIYNFFFPFFKLLWSCDFPCVNQGWLQGTGESAPTIPSNA